MSDLYVQSVPLLIKYLKALSGLLDKAVAFASEKGMKHEEILTLRLRDDMKGLPFQVQCVSNVCKFLAVRIFKLEVDRVEDNETTFAQLQQRVATTISTLERIDPTSLDLDAIAKEPVMMNTGYGSFRFESGQTYVAEYTIPYFHFHLATAYCILRHLGVPLGSMDYLKDVFHAVEA